jgi:hypothetical protein
MGIGNIRSREVGSPFFIRIVHDYMKKFEPYRLKLDVSINEDASFMPGYLRPSDGCRECAREVFYLLTGAPSTAEPESSLRGAKNFFNGSVNHAIWPMLFENAGKWSGKFWVVNGGLQKDGKYNRLTDHELWVSGTPDWFIVTKQFSIPIELKTMDPTKYLQRIALRNKEVVETSQLTEMFRKPYPNNEIQLQWYMRMTKKGLYAKGSSKEFIDAVEKFFGYGYILYLEKSQSMFFPFKQNYNFDLLKPFVDIMKKVNICIREGSVPPKQCIKDNDWFKGCEFARYCYSKGGDKARKRLGDELRT